MKKECEYAIFDYNDVDSDLIDDLAEYLDSEVFFIFNFFDINNSCKPLINIISTKEEYDGLFKEEYGYDAPKYSRGIFKRDGSINYLSIKDYDNTTHVFEKEQYSNAYIGFKKTLIHEYVHYVNYLFNKSNDCGPTAVYLREGIAIYLSKQNDDKEINFNFSLEDILNNNSNKKIYNAYYLLVKYLIENYDKDFILELFKSNRKAKEFLIGELFDKINKSSEKI